MLDDIRRKRSQIPKDLYKSVLTRLYAFSPKVLNLSLGNLRLSSQASKSFRYFDQNNFMSYALCGEKGVVLKMIFCPEGTFIMGHEDQGDNQPRTEVIDTPFLLGQTEVTQELYEAVMETNPSYFSNKPQNPVEKVSWEDAILFCNRLSELQGLDECYTKNSNQEYDWLCDFSKNGYRLPREKEWEYAAKAGTENKWAGTDNADELGEYAVYYVYSNKSPQPVESKAPNEWGFYDMSGNVWEWCWDEYKPDNDEYASSVDRVFRGGSWGSNDASHLSSAGRSYNSPSLRDYLLGFRVCRTVV